VALLLLLSSQLRRETQEYATIGSPFRPFWCTGLRDHLSPVATVSVHRAALTLTRICFVLAFVAENNN
jgi:hypothetical protein